MNLDTDKAWYCARTKPKHEHIAAANLNRSLGLEVFNPRLRVERSTRRGVVRATEPLFPCYIFILCGTNTWSDVRYVNGISSLVHFGDRVPSVPSSVIDELKDCFESEEPLDVEDRLMPGEEVSIADGAFCGLEAIVLKSMPARQRVQVLLDILGRPTLVEVDRGSINVMNRRVQDRFPTLALAR
ncbi:MAG: transcriptional activator RfaH [Verrucomicrobiota bacterium]